MEYSLLLLEYILLLLEYSELRSHGVQSIAFLEYNDLRLSEVGMTLSTWICALHTSFCYWPLDAELRPVSGPNNFLILTTQKHHHLTFSSSSPFPPLTITTPCLPHPPPPPPPPSLHTPPFLLPLSALNPESLSLFTFKNSISHDPQSYLCTWLPSSLNLCAWRGILCHQTQVISLTLPNLNLLGPIHPSLASLPSLHHMNLCNNRLFALLPPPLFFAPRLQTLMLFNNLLTGSTQLYQFSPFWVQKKPECSRRIEPFL